MVWAYLQDWIVQDGQLPAVEVGTLLPLGLGFRGRPTTDSAPYDGAPRRLDGARARSRYDYEVGGTAVSEAQVTRTEYPGELPVRTDDFGLDLGAYVVWASVRESGLLAPSVGDQVALDGRFTVLADDELGESVDPAVDVVREWRVDGIQVEQWQWVRDGTVSAIPLPGEPATWVSGERFEPVPIERIDAWPDMRRFEAGHRGFSYVLDLSLG